MSNLKAIETNYKGYRFRSRLEARWAVALDADKVEWAYEEQGFETPEGRYLPDFTIKIANRFSTFQACHLEIKPKTNACDQWPSDILRAPEVYMAGTMKSGEGWRGVGVTDRERGSDVYSGDDPREAWPRAAFYTGSFWYKGPFSVSCDHGCGHRTPHLAFSCADEPVHPLPFACQAAINSADIFACYLDRVDCYGSLVELGMASALGKTIWLGMSPEVRAAVDYVDRGWGPSHDLWFAQELASSELVVVEKSQARAAFDQFLAERMKGYYPPKEALLSRFFSGNRHDQRLHVIYGDPGDFVEKEWGCRALPFTLSPAAMQAGRQARFEHGQSGGVL